MYFKESCFQKPQKAGMEIKLHYGVKTVYPATKKVAWLLPQFCYIFHTSLSFL